MNDKQAITVLTKLLAKYPVTDDESEALRLAIGILAWSTLAEGRKQSQKDAQAKRRGAGGGE